MPYHFAPLTTNRDMHTTGQRFLTETDLAKEKLDNFEKTRAAVEEHFRKNFAALPSPTFLTYWSEDKTTALIEVIDGRGTQNVVALYKIFST